MTSRKLQLNRETVRILSSREMAGVAGGVVRGTAISCVCTNVGCPNTNTGGCPANLNLAVRAAK